MIQIQSPCCRLALAYVLVVFAANPATAAERTVSILECGAVAGGETLCTHAIQKAIDACATSGGGIVRVPAGTFLTGALHLKSRITLWLDKGATLLGSRNHADYYGPSWDAAGKASGKSPDFHNLLEGDNLYDIAIRGQGTIDGNGTAFRDKSQPRAKNIYLVNCRNVCIEDVRLRDAGCWMQHYRMCDHVTIRNIDVNNHVAFNNDGLNIDSCRNVTITDCRVDSDDDGIVLKSLSDRPCQNVLIANCTVSSHCNALKLGTESGGGFLDIVIRDCTVFSPKHSQKIYGQQRGLAAIALEMVDGGRLENVRVSNIDITGVSVPIFLRLGNRARAYNAGPKPGVGQLRNVQISNITAREVSPIGCSITGLPGNLVEDVTLSNVQLSFEGGGTHADALREAPERETSYPESTMFGTLPAYGIFCRHARHLRMANIQLLTTAADARPAIVCDDVEHLQIEGLKAGLSPGASTMLRLVQTRQAQLRGCSAESPVDVLLRVEGEQSTGILIEQVETGQVKKLVELSPEVSPQAAVTIQGRK